MKIPALMEVFPTAPKDPTGEVKAADGTIASTGMDGFLPMLLQIIASGLAQTVNGAQQQAASTATPALPFAVTEDAGTQSAPSESRTVVAGDHATAETAAQGRATVEVTANPAMVPAYPWFANRSTILTQPSFTAMAGSAVTGTSSAANQAEQMTIIAAGPTSGTPENSDRPAGTAVGRIPAEIMSLFPRMALEAPESAVLASLPNPGQTHEAQSGTGKPVSTPVVEAVNVVKEIMFALPVISRVIAEPAPGTPSAGAPKAAPAALPAAVPGLVVTAVSTPVRDPAPMTATSTVTAKTPQASPEPIRVIAPETSSASASEPVRTAVSENARVAIPENSWAAVPENARAAVPENAWATVPENARATVPENARATVSENARAAVPENARAAVPENARPGVPERFVAAAPAATPAQVPAPGRAVGSALNQEAAPQMSAEPLASAAPMTDRRATEDRGRVLVEAPASPSIERRAATPVVSITPSIVELKPEQPRQAGQTHRAAAEPVVAAAGDQAAPQQRESRSSGNDQTSNRPEELPRPADTRVTPPSMQTPKSTFATIVSKAEAAVPGTLSGDALRAAVMDQIVSAVHTRINDRTSEIHVALKPESLGDVTIHVRSEEGAMRAEINVQNATIKSMLETNLPQLRDQLAARGVVLQKIEIIAGTQAQFQDSAGQSHSARQQSGGRRHRFADETIPDPDSRRTLGYNTMELVI